LRAGDRGIARAFRSVGDATVVFDFGQRSLGPLDGTCVVAGPKAQAANLLEQLRPLDQLTVVTEEIQPGRERELGELPIAGFPVERADLAVQTSRIDAVRRRCQLPEHCLEVRQGFGSIAGQSEEVSQSLPNNSHLASAISTLRERSQRARIVAHRIVIGINRASPVSGGDQICRAPPFVGSEAPVMSERFKLAQPRLPCMSGALESPGGSLVQLAAAGQQYILVNRLVHESVAEPVASAVAATPDHLEELRLAETVERGGQACRLARDGT
jgi:hypothetical protein